MEIRLTQYSHGAGCGCKISPAILDTMLHSEIVAANFPQLLVGNASKDDAAVYDLGDGTCIVSTTDFFMPIVDDPRTFGSIASVNAISDIYAMGISRVDHMLMVLGVSLMMNKQEREIITREMIRGFNDCANEAGTLITGGQSIMNPWPIIGGVANKCFRTIYLPLKALSGHRYLKKCFLFHHFK